MSKQEKIVEGQLVAYMIPAKEGSLRVHHPMVVLEFRVKDGGVLELYSSERSDAGEVFDKLSSAIKVGKGWSKPLMF